LTAASVLIAPSAYRAEVSRLFVAPSWRNCGVGGQLLAAQSRPAGHSGSSRSSKWSNTAPTQSTSINAEGGTSSTDDQPPRRLRTDRTWCFVPIAADSVVHWTVVRRRPRVPWPPSPSLLAAQTDVPAAPSARTGITQLVVLDQGCSADRRSVTDVLRDVVAITAGRSWLPARRTGLESASETTSGRSVEEGCRPHLSGRIYNVSRTQTTITVLGCGGENGH
jgi:hypothetical protein